MQQTKPFSPRIFISIALFLFHLLFKLQKIDPNRHLARPPLTLQQQQFIAPLKRLLLL